MSAPHAVEDPSVSDNIDTERPGRDWFSGWCGPGPCRDGHRPIGQPDSDTIKHYCRYEAINGERVARRRLRCACDCHQNGTAGAIQADGFIPAALKEVAADELIGSDIFGEDLDDVA